MIFYFAVVGAIFQGGLFGLAGKFPLVYINAVSKGLSLSGVFTALAQVFSTMFGSSPVTSALVYFLVAVVVMILTLIVYLLVRRTVSFFVLHVFTMQIFAISFVFLLYCQVFETWICIWKNEDCLVKGSRTRYAVTMHGMKLQMDGWIYWVKEKWWQFRMRDREWK